jgi:hypothetical protein
VIVDGTTQPGYAGQPLIQINGAGLGANGDGLQILAGNCVVSGLVIYHCKRDGIRIQNGGTNVVQGNYLGTDVTGTNNLGNTGSGVYILQSSGNLIGGTNAAARNVISGNVHGIYIDDNSLPDTGTGNLVQGNYIGVTATGTKALGNTNNGVYIVTAPGNVIGGTLPGSGNLISGNALSGIFISGAGANGNLIQGNLIGTDLSGTLAISNRLFYRHRPHRQDCFGKPHQRSGHRRRGGQPHRRRAAGGPEHHLREPAKRNAAHPDRGIK